MEFWLLRNVGVSHVAVENEGPLTLSPNYVYKWDTQSETVRIKNCHQRNKGNIMHTVHFRPARCQRHLIMHD